MKSEDGDTENIVGSNSCFRKERVDKRIVKEDPNEEAEAFKLSMVICFKAIMW